MTAVYWNMTEGSSDFLLSSQGISLRKVLLQNYLFLNKKNNLKNDVAELRAAGEPLSASLCGLRVNRYQWCSCGGFISVRELLLI